MSRISGRRNDNYAAIKLTLFAAIYYLQFLSFAKLRPSAYPIPFPVDATANFMKFQWQRFESAVEWKPLQQSLTLKKAKRLRFMLENFLEKKNFSTSEKKNNKKISSKFYCLWKLGIIAKCNEGNGKLNFQCIFNHFYNETFFHSRTARRMFDFNYDNVE